MYYCGPPPAVLKPHFSAIAFSKVDLPDPFSPTKENDIPCQFQFLKTFNDWYRKRILCIVGGIFFEQAYPFQKHILTCNSCVFIKLEITSISLFYHNCESN